MTTTAKSRKSRVVSDWWMEVGTLVRIVGERGTFVVMSSALFKDGSVSLYGGDADPNGHRCYRAVMPERIIAETRKNVIAKRKRQGAE